MRFLIAFLTGLLLIFVIILTVGVVLGLGELAYRATGSTAVGLGTCVVILALGFAVSFSLVERI